MNQKEPAMFKSEDSLWQMMARGIKQWDFRFYDLSDERIIRLASGHFEQANKKGLLPLYLPDEKFVCFEDKSTGQVLQFKFNGLSLARFAPGWCFIRLGPLVVAYDKDGGVINI